MNEQKKKLSPGVGLAIALPVVVVLIILFVIMPQVRDDEPADTAVNSADDVAIDQPWLCDGTTWIKNGTHNEPMPTEPCDAEHMAPQFAQGGDDMFNWSTMNEGPYRDSVTYALSNDLVNWEPRNVILAEHASVPGAVIKDGIIYVYFVDVSTDGIPEQLGMVMSEDEGATWTAQRTLTITGLGDKAPADPAPILLDDGRIRVYFFDINEARITKPASGIEPTNKIYSAISTDGINFTMEDGVRFERQGIFDPDVELFDGTWYMYGGDLAGQQVIYATSDDGLTFTKQGVAYQGGAVPDVYYDGSMYYLYTAGIDIATGTTPTSFTRTNNHFTDPDSQGATADPSVIPLSNEYYMMVYKIQGAQ